MKKSLLTLVSVMLTTASALAAGWVEPIPEFTAPVFDGTPQFLYNTGAKGFFCGGNDYNTRASISTSMGDSIYFQPVVDVDGSYYFRCYPSVAKKGNFFFVSANDWQSSWVDAPNDGKFHETLDETSNYPGVDKWALVPQGNDIYKIYNTTEMGQIPEYDPIEGVGYYGIAEYFKGEGNNTRTYFYDPSQTYTYVDEQEEEHTGDVFSGSFYDEWRFVSQEAYGVWAAKKAIFDAAVALGKTLDDAATECPGLDVSAIKAVFDNPNSTEAELKQANEDLKVLMVNYKLKDATVDNPANITEKIVNATFDKVGDFTGWNGTGFGAGGTTSTNAEVYGKSFDTWQDIEGLPGGIYMVACNGYTRYQNAQADYDAWSKGIASETKIYLKSETLGQYFTQVMHVSQGGSIDEPIGAGATTQVKFIGDDQAEHTLYCPNTMAAANDYFHDGTNRYRNEAYGPMTDGETLRIGVFNQKATGSDWSIFDDFQLMYFGNGLDAYQLWGSKVKEANQISFDGYYYGAPEKQYYDHVMSELTTATTKEAISEAVKLVDLAVDTVNASRQAYEVYVAAIAAAETWMNEAGITEGDDNYNKLSDYVSAPAEDNEEVTEAHGYPNGCANYILNLAEGEFVGKLSVKDIIAETEYLQNMQAEAVRSNLVDGSDLTNLIVNPGFEEAGGKGWSLDTHNGAATNKLTNWHGGNSNNYCAEAYEQNFDVYQVIENVPNGLYEVSVQAFYRTTSNQAAYDAYVADPKMEGDAKVLSYVYFNSFANPVKSVMEIQYEENLANNCWAVPGTDPQKYTLDGMASASTAFSLPDENVNFTQKVYGLVTDGKIRLGIRNLEGSKGGRWTLWDNFKLVYRAKNPNAVAAVLEAKLDEYSAFVTEQSDNELINSAEKTLAGNAIDNAETALGSGDVDKMWDALIAINDAYVHTQEHVALMKETKDVMDELTNAINEYSETASADALAEAQEILLEGYDEYTNEELAVLNAKAKDAIAKLKIPATTGASDDNPVDFTDVIVNHDIEQGATVGWKYTKNGGNGPNLDAGIEGKSVEFWNGSASNLQFNFYQEIAHLPAGKYELTVTASNSLNGQEDPGNPGRAFLYVATYTAESDSTWFSSDPVVVQPENCPEKYADYSVIFSVEEGQLVTIGVKTSGTMTARWFVCDNFKLKYFGTESQQEDSENPMNVDGIEVAEGAQIVAIYTVSGAPVATLQKGLNIVKYADGSVKKIFVK